MTAPVEVTVEYGGASHGIAEGQTFAIGRVADLSIDDNPYLHRHLLSISQDGGVWWLSNVGQATPVSVATALGEFQALLGSGARLPLVFPHLRVMFTAGASSYELLLTCHVATLAPTKEPDILSGERTQGPPHLTESQRLLVTALCEPVLRAAAPGFSAVPTSAAAAERLGWPLTTFNRKLDAVCERLDRAGVEGLRGDFAQLATTRKARLVEYAVLARLVSADDLAALDAAITAPNARSNP